MAKATREETQVVQFNPHLMLGCPLQHPCLVASCQLSVLICHYWQAANFGSNEPASFLEEGVEKISPILNGNCILGVCPHMPCVTGVKSPLPLSHLRPVGS